MSCLKLAVQAAVLTFLALTTFSQVEASCGKLKPLDYEYFSTGTRYDNALNYLRVNQDRNLPETFRNESLGAEHARLLSNQCRPVMLYFVGRHSARFPDGYEIEQYNEDLYALIDRLRQERNNCTIELQDILSWKSEMVPELDNLITEIGAREEIDIARRFKKIYPEFFDAHKTDVHYGVTKRIRTAQTAAQFLSEVDNLRPPKCDLATLPTNDVARPEYNLEAVKSADCYNDMMATHRNQILEFNKQCAAIHGKESKTADPTLRHLKNPELKMRIANRVAGRLGLEVSSEKAPITPRLLESIYGMCQFETGMRGHSIWCSLLDKEDIEELEYISDSKSYIKNVLGPEATTQQACPVAKELLETMEELSSNEQQQRAYFYFTHAGAMKKLIAFFNLFKDDQSFAKWSVHNFERRGEIPEHRNWRDSLVVPFSANIEFVQYRCASDFKVLAAVNEQPVKIPGCSGDVCSLAEFERIFGRFRDCDLAKICAKH